MTRKPIWLRYNDRGSLSVISIDGRRTVFLNSDEWKVEDLGVVESPNVDFNDEYLLVDRCVFCRGLRPVIIPPVRYVTAVLWGAFLVYGTKEGTLGIYDLARNKIAKERATGLRGVYRVEVDENRGWIALCTPQSISIYTGRLEWLGTIQQQNKRVVVWNYWVAVCTERSLLLYRVTSSGFNVREINVTSTNIVLGANYLAYADDLGHRLSVYDMDKSETHMIATREDATVESLAFSSSENVACGWSTGEITTHETPRTTRGSSVLNSIVMDTDEPVSDKARQFVMAQLFQGRPPPSYNLDDVVRLFVACSKRVKEVGQVDFTEKQQNILQSIRKLCADTEVTPANVTFFLDAVESQLRLLFVII